MHINKNGLHLAVMNYINLACGVLWREKSSRYIDVLPKSSAFRQDLGLLSILIAEQTRLVLRNPLLENKVSSMLFMFQHEESTDVQDNCQWKTKKPWQQYWPWAYQISFSGYLHLDFFYISLEILLSLTISYAKHLPIYMKKTSVRYLTRYKVTFHLIYSL